MPYLDKDSTQYKAMGKPKPGNYSSHGGSMTMGGMGYKLGKKKKSMKYKSGSSHGKMGNPGGGY